MSVWLKDSALAGLFQCFDKDGNGSITYEEFTDALLQVKK